MHPPFHIPPSGVHDPAPSGRLIRRNRPEPLRFELPPQGQLSIHTPVRRPAPPRESPDGAGWLTRLLRGLRHAPAH